MQHTYMRQCVLSSLSCVLPSLKRIMLYTRLDEKKKKENPHTSLYILCYNCAHGSVFLFPCLEHETRTTVHYEQRAKLRIF